MNRTLGATTPWLIISAAVVIIFGGALTWYNIKYPSDDVASTSTIAPTTSTTATTTGSTATTTTAGTDQISSDLLSFTIEPLKLSFNYPKEWGAATISNGKIKVNTGYSYGISFASTSGLIMGFASTDMTAGRGGTSYEMMNISTSVRNVTDCASIKTAINFGPELTRCKDIVSGGKTVGILLSYDYPADSMEPGKSTEAYYFTKNSQYPFVGLDKESDSAETLADFEALIKSFKSSAI